MKSAESKLVLFLASSEITEQDFRMLAQLFESGRLGRYVSAAEYLRKQRRPAIEHIKRIERDVTREFEKREVDPVFLKDLSRMLSRTKLTPTEAVRRLAQELGVDVERIPRSLRAGIAQLLEVVDMREIWAAAQRVITKTIDGPQKHAWPLRDQDPG